MEIKRELIASVTVPLYIRNYVISNNINASYYEKSKKQLPLTFCDKALYESQGLREPNGVRYTWKSYPVIRDKVKKTVDYLFDNDKNERVVSNNNQIGKKRMGRINGQDIYSGNISRHARNNMMGAIKENFKMALVNSLDPLVKFKLTWVEKYNKKTRETTGEWIPQAQQPIKRYPLILEVECWDFLIDEEFCKGKNWDLGNRILPYNKAFEDMLTKCKVIKDDCTKYITGPPHPIFCPLEPGEQRKLVYNIYVDKRDIITRSIQYIKGLGSRLG